MGIKGIYAEIGSGDRIALSKLAVETYEQKGRPLRLAIDISIWLFQIQSGKGGTNPALRTFYYRLLRLISLSIHPLFVFDGPNKPPFKRNKRTGPNVASIPEFLAKQLLKQFGLPFHLAPGEAEAECALLQQEGIVDAVLSEDVDTLMFGSGVTLRNWSAEGTLKTKTATHVNVYDARKTKAGSGLDRPGMILVALMSGGDYIPEGIPGCGPKTACEAARAGLGEELYSIKGNAPKVAQWKERLVHELRTNESKFFRAKHKALVIPDGFPRKDVLRYYTDPCVSPKEKLETLRNSLKWDEAIDIPGLREFTVDAFKWEFLSGAKHFIRNLAPALLIKQLRLRAEREPCDDTYVIAQEEARLIKTIHSTRQHITTDNSTELRVGYVPINIVDIDLEAEDPDPELSQDGLEFEDEDMPIIGEDPSSPKKKRTPRDYDAHAMEKIWVLETWIRVGVPLKIQDYEESFRSAKRYEEMKAARKEAAAAKKKQPTTKKKVDMSQGSLDQFTKVTKAGIRKPRARSKSPIEELNLAGDQGVITTAGQKNTSKQSSVEELDLADCGEAQHSTKIRSTSVVAQTKQTTVRQGPTFRMPPLIPPSSPKPTTLDTIDLSLSPHPQPVKKQRTLRRSQSDTTTMTPSVKLTDAPYHHLLHNLDSENHETSSQPDRRQDLEPIRELSPFVSTRRPRSPIRRVQSIPTPPTPSSMRATTPPSDHGTSAQPPLKKTTPKRKRQPQATEIITLSSSPPMTPSSRQKSIKDWFSPSSAGGALEIADPPSPSPRRGNMLQINLARLPSPPLFREPLTQLHNMNILPTTQTMVGEKVLGRKDQVPVSMAYADDSDDELPPLPFALTQTKSVGTSTATTGIDVVERASRSVAAPAYTLSSDPPSGNEATSRKPSSSESATSISSRATSSTSTTTIITTAPLPSPALPLLLPANSKPKPKRIIRIRESLLGAFAEEDVIDLASSDDVMPSMTSTSASVKSGTLTTPATVVQHGDDRSDEAGMAEMKKRKRDVRTREWRVSQVEVLDLT